MQIKTKKIVTVLLLALFSLAVLLLVFFDAHKLLNLPYLKQQADLLQTVFATHYALATILFIALLIMVSSLPIPAVAVLCVTAGMIYGFWLGLLLVSLCCGVGAVITFSVSKRVSKRFTSSYLHKVVNQYAAALGNTRNLNFWYATAIRLIPGVPFFIVNASLGLANIKLLTFVLSTQLGMLAMFAVLVNAGNHLSSISSMSQIMTPQIIIAFSLVAAFIVITRYVYGNMSKEIAS